MGLRVSELFVSIQGESTWAGLPCAFVRLAGCNLRCSFCDTAWTWDDPGRVMAVEEVLAWVADRACSMVEVTGGEPLLQPEALDLMARLRDQGRRVLLETSGALDIGPVPAGVWVVMDVKTPGSGMAQAMDPDNIPRLLERAKQGWGGEVKFVTASEEDARWALDRVEALGLTGRLPVLLSPAAGLLEPARLAEIILESGMEVRMQIQLHRIIWPGGERGR